MSRHEVADLEVAGWRALASGGQEARAFYQRVLDDTVVMLLPGGIVLHNRAEILDSMSGRPWTSYRLDEPTVLTPSTGVAVVVYGVVARREGAPAYSAQISSTYVRRGDGWKLALHQQTPRG